MASLLKGAKIVDPKGGEVSVSSLEGKHILLYFSAHWCPPCRKVTPMLAEYREKFASSKNFEVVFVSSDKDQAQFDEYHGSMPWPAVDFADRELKAKLSSKFRVNGIPTLVVLSPDGQTVTTGGVQAFIEDPECEDFPWKPKSFAELMDGCALVKPDGSEAGSFQEVTKGKVIGVYFSAHWCGPCKIFTPQLAKTYKKLQEQGKNFEVVFVSGDRDAGSFADYHKEMPWLAIPFADEKRRAELSKHFEVQGIPSLVILAEDGTVSRKSGRAVISGDPNGEKFPWTPEPIEELDDPTPINEGPCLVVFADGAKCPTGEELIATLKPGAAKVRKGAGEDDDEVAMFVASEDDGLIETVRKFAKVPESDVPQLVLLDVPQQTKYILTGVEATSAEVERIITAYRAGTLEGKKGIRD